MMQGFSVLVPLVLSVLMGLVAPACITDPPSKLLWDPEVIEHTSVVSALSYLEQTLEDLFKNKTRDGLSFAVVHASTPEKIYAFNKGVLKMNQTDSNATHENAITSDSVFRVASVSKNFAAYSALFAQNLAKPSTQNPSLPEISLDTPARFHLPAFKLPEKDWENGGKDITLRMLASHTSGITREAYSTGFNLVLGLGKANATTIGAGWASATAEDVVAYIAKTALMFAPGEKAAYSNIGPSILASAVVNYYNTLTNSQLSWSDFMVKEIFAPLNMTHSFFDPIPANLLPYIGVPGAPNMVDTKVGEGYNPAGGLWTSTNDLAKYLYTIWLHPDPRPSLITPSQRRHSQTPFHDLLDGKQQVGPGWEIELISIPTGSAGNKTYAVYGKSGDAFGSHAWIDVVPNLGYGLAIITQENGDATYQGLFPSTVKALAHKALLPALAEALAERTRVRFAGNYTFARDGGDISDERTANPTNTTRRASFARLKVKDHMLYIKEFFVNGTNALEALDRVGWAAAESGPRWYSSDAGTVLVPAEGASETAAYGEGAQVWRFMIPGLETCDYFDWDGYKDQNGWPLTKIVLVEKEPGGVELHWPPFDVVLSREVRRR